MTIPIVLAVWGLSFIGAFSAEAQSGQTCAKIVSDAARLECYDLVFKKSVVSGDTSGTGKWRVREEISKLDDTANVSLTLTSSDKHPGKFGGSKESTIFIACRENTTSIYVSFADHFMSDNAGGGEVTYRIDKKEAAKKSFRESSDNSVLGLWSGASAIPFIKGLVGGETLLLRAIPFSESAVTATFDIRGLENALKPLRTACKW